MSPPVAGQTFVPKSLPTPATPKANFNPFYSNIPTASTADDTYEFSHYKPTWPQVDWEPLPGNIPSLDVGLRADKEMKALLSAASKVDTLSPAIGTRIEGIDLRNLSDVQKDEL